MLYPVCTIKDAKGSCWPVQCYETDASAIRDFAMQINSGSGTLAYSPADFQLIKVGSFDNKKCEFTVCSPVVILCSGIDVAGVKDAK